MNEVNKPKTVGLSRVARSFRKRLIASVLIVLLLVGPAVFAVANPDAREFVVASVQGFFASIRGGGTVYDRDAQPVQGAIEPDAAYSRLGLGQREIVHYSFGSDGSAAAITTDGTLWTWGGNIDGRLGLGDVAYRTTPQRVTAPGVTSWKYVSKGARHTLAIDQDDRLWAWGQNYQGQVGNGTREHQHLPVLITGGASAWARVDGGNNFTLAVDTDGNLWTWGFINSPSDVPQLITTGPGLGNWSQVSAGQDHAMGIDINGNIWAWGHNGSSRLGVGAGTSGVFVTAVPLPIAGDNLPAFTYVSAGQWHTLALGVDGSIWAWGSNHTGQLGLGLPVAVFEDLHTPTQIEVAGVGSWNAVSAGQAHSIALDDQGRLWGWGSNQQGQLALNTASGGILSPAGNFNVPQLAPVDVGPTVYINNSGQTIPASWQSIDAGWAGNMAMSPDGTLWSWGHNGPRTTTTQSIQGQLAKGVAATQSSAQGHNSNNWRPWRIAASLVPSNSSNWQTPNDATIPNHNATNVTNINTPFVYIFFDREMCVAATSRGTITFIPQDNPAEAISVSLTNFEWASTQAEFNSWPVHHPRGPMNHASRGLQSVFRVPLPELESNTTYLAVVEGFLDASFGVRGINEMYPHGTATLPADHPMRNMYPDRPWIFHTGEIVHPEVPLEKILHMPEGTPVPSVLNRTFEFVATPRQVQLSDVPLISSMPVAEVPALGPPLSIVLDPASIETSGAVSTMRGSLDLWPLIRGMDFSAGAGVYVWLIEETYGSSNTQPPSHMRYDLSRFELRVTVDRHGRPALAEILETGAGPGFVAGEKIDDLEFTNIYVRNIPFEVSKTVVSLENSAPSDAVFNFTLDLALHELAPLVFPLTAQIYDRDDNPVPAPRGVVTIAGLTGTSFQLMHGERLVISGLPAGTTFNVVEASDPDFRASVRVVIDGEVVHELANPTPNIALPTGNHILAGEDRNAADFTNAHQLPVESGLLIQSAPYTLLSVLAVVVLTMFIALRKRKIIEDMPIV